MFYEDSPLVSIIIPCRNEEAFIARCLDSILGNQYPADRLEVIVVDGTSHDRTRDIVAHYARQHSIIRLVDNPKATIPAAMNIGMRQSTGQIIMKVDAHSTYPRDYITACVRHLFAYDADMTGGICSITPRDMTLMARSIAVALAHWFASGNAYVKIGSSEPRWADAVAFGCWRRETLEKLGPFDERLTGSSDMDSNRRLLKSGGRILLVPHIKVAYYADADLKAFWNHNFSDGVWTTYALKFGKHASSWRHWVPLAFVVSLIALGIAIVADSRFIWLFAGIAGTYCLVNLIVSIRLSYKLNRLLYSAILPIVFVVRHVAHGFGALCGLFLAVFPGVTWQGRRAGIKGHGYPGRRIVDLIASLSGLLILSPFFVVLGSLIKLDSKGPVFYGGERLGRFGKPFNMLKFRTMCSNVEEAGALITPEGDSRITRLGGFLRKYKLDELPQLINVVKGEMSLVGPRPEASFYFQYYAEDEKHTIHSVRPGMTDYGSLRFHDEGRASCRFYRSD